jgi:hypothetical protein
MITKHHTTSWCSLTSTMAWQDEWVNRGSAVMPPGYQIIDLQYYQ